IKYCQQLLLVDEMTDKSSRFTVFRTTLKGQVIAFSFDDKKLIYLPQPYFYYDSKISLNIEYEYAYITQNGQTNINLRSKYQATNVMEHCPQYQIEQTITLDERNKWQTYKYAFQGYNSYYNRQTTHVWEIIRKYHEDVEIVVHGINEYVLNIMTNIQWNYEMIFDIKHP
ncbi:unnamed protein product, partial [Didymodactylos carnosus]